MSNRNEATSLLSDMWKGAGLVMLAVQELYVQDIVSMFRTPSEVYFSKEYMRNRISHLVQWYLRRFNEPALRVSALGEEIIVQRDESIDASLYYPSWSEKVAWSNNRLSAVEKDPLSVPVSEISKARIIWMVDTAIKQKEQLIIEYTARRTRK